MKKTLSLLALATVITSFSSMAHADTLGVENRSYNVLNITILDNETVKDTICLREGSTANFRDYLPNHEYTINVKFKANGCGGESLNEVTQDFQTRPDMTNLSVEGNGQIFNN
jgi:hypothetical protein